MGKGSKRRLIRRPGIARGKPLNAGSIGSGSCGEPCGKGIW